MNFPIFPLGVDVVSSIKRTVLATAVAALGCGLTYFWHIKNEPKSLGDSESDVIAYIATTKKEIHRKGSNNTLWEPAEQLDRLRSGDSVRTSGDSEARIQFYQSNRYIDLESDSMIVIQKQESEINLELLEGSLFVNGVDKANNPEVNKSTLTLKSQGGKVDLSKSAAQLSGSSKDKMSLKVIKGTAQFIKTSGKTESIQEGKEGGIGKAGVQVSAEKVKIILPDNANPFYTNALNPTPMTIKWSGFPAKARVILESGSTRKKLDPTLTDKNLHDQFNVVWKPGVYYWKLKALDPVTKASLGESATYKTEVIGRFPPTPIAPEPNFVMQTRKPTENITLRWNTPQEYKDVQVELQNDKKQILFSKRLPASQEAQDIPNLPLGTYSWKLTAFPQDNSEPLKSPDYRFHINEKKLIKIPITWNATLQETQYFVNTEPKLNLMWSAEDKERVSKWKVYIAPEGTDISKVEAIESLQNNYEKVVAKPGRYLAFVSALDAENESIGTSEVRPFSVQPLPLLIAPKLLPNDNKDFLAQPDGSYTLQWNAITEANNYIITIKDKENKLVTQLHATSSSAKLNNLMPGSYSIEINAVDKHGRNGETSKKRMIQVPDKSEVKAPTLKKIKVN